MHMAWLFHELRSLHTTDMNYGMQKSASPKTNDATSDFDANSNPLPLFPPPGLRRCASNACGNIKIQPGDSPWMLVSSLRSWAATTFNPFVAVQSYIFGRWRATPKHSCQSCYPPRDLSPSLRGCPLPFAIARARIPPHKANPWLFVDGTCGRRTKGWMKDLESESV